MICENAMEIAKVRRPPTSRCSYGVTTGNGGVSAEVPRTDSKFAFPYAYRVV